MAVIAAHRNAGHSGGDNVAIGIYSPSSPHLHTPLPPFCPSLISLMVSVDVKHHVYGSRISLVNTKPWGLLGTGRRRARGYGGGGRGRLLYLSLRHCHHQNDSCIKVGSDESHFNVSSIVRDKVTRQCPQTTILEVKGEPKQIRTEVPLLTSLPPYR